jgi:hypothetical protein
VALATGETTMNPRVVSRCNSADRIDEEQTGEVAWNHRVGTGGRRSGRPTKSQSNPAREWTRRFGSDEGAIFGKCSRGIHFTRERAKGRCPASTGQEMSAQLSRETGSDVVSGWFGRKIGSDVGRKAEEPDVQGQAGQETSAKVLVSSSTSARDARGVATLSGAGTSDCGP